ncbi:MAG: glycosyltransferase family 4 protein [Methanomassiliicoccales archaeon]
MNVLILTPEFHTVWGGVGTYVNELAKTLSHKVELYIITPKRVTFNKNIKIIEEEYKYKNNVNLYSVGIASDTFLFNVDFQLKVKGILEKILKKENIDIIHTQSTMPDLFINTSRIKIPILTTIHTTVQGQINAIIYNKINFSFLERSEFLSYLISPIIIPLENNYYKKRYNYITVSNWAKKIFSKEKKIDENKINVIYNGIDINAFNPGNKDVSFLKNMNPNIKTNMPIITFISRVVGKKGILTLLEAIKIIEKYYDVQFIIAGPGDQNIIKKLPNSCLYLGYLTTEEKKKLLASSDIFVLPSYYENFPFAILEAMSSGTAIVTTNVGGIPEMITNDQEGILINPGDSKMLAETLISLIENDNKRKKLGEAARKKAIQEFNWNITAKKTELLYESILKN